MGEFTTVLPNFVRYIAFQKTRKNRRNGKRNGEEEARKQEGMESDTIYYRTIVNIYLIARSITIPFIIRSLSPRVF